MSPLPTKALQRAYQRKWLTNRRTAWLAANGPCVRCGSADRLEVHHIDPSQKVSHRLWSWSEPRRLAELAKCEVLCYACHKAETRAQQEKPLTHGTRRGYRKGCRCTECRGAAAAYAREFRNPTPIPRRAPALSPTLWTLAAAQMTAGVKL